MPRINPLNRRPKTRRLVVAVRGAAGSGKSHFAASLAEAGVGRLCFFDTERKARLIAGSDGARFDALEIQHPDELAEFIEWALEGEGRSQGYGCYALDSWTMYFGRKHRETLQAVRARTGDPLAQPSAAELAADQMIFQEVLRRLCIDSGACVVITDQIGARGQEDREENELGRVLPMTASGLEYFVDVLLEMETRLVNFELARVARVVKTNSGDFPLGLELVNPTFASLFARLPSTVAAAGASALPSALANEADTTLLPGDLEFLPDLPTVAALPEPTMADLFAIAERFAISREALLIAARHYHGVAALDRLSGAQIADLMQRLLTRYASDARPDTQMEPPRAEPEQDAAPGFAGADELPGSNGSAPKRNARR